jgi:hypothetical protein
VSKQTKLEHGNQEPKTNTDQEKTKRVMERERAAETMDVHFLFRNVPDD